MAQAHYCHSEKLRLRNNNRACSLRVNRNMTRTLLTYLFAATLTAFIAGCSGGSGDPGVADAGADTGTPSPTTPSAENFIAIEAIPGPIVAVRVGEQVVLDDKASYARSAGPISYSWSFSYKPAGSQAELQGADTASPSFVADVRGIYMLQLVVSADGVTSQRAISSVVATVAPERLTGPFNHAGLSSNCSVCHDGVNLQSNGEFISPKLADHLATSNTCQACHTPLGFALIAFVDHQEVFGSCSECHNGVQAIGKSEFHRPTEAECDDCHNTNHFLELGPDGSFDHSGITRVCASCHNGTVATGKHESHIVTDSECGYCHTTSGFLPAYPDHTGPDVVGQRCDSCHNDSSASGQSIGHPATRVDCAVCHSIVSFSLGGVFDHSVIDSVTQPCADCHTGNNSINAIGKTPNHPATDADCGNCHNTESFAIVFSFDHTGIVDNCASCHGLTASGKSPNHLPTTEDCSVCHTLGTFASGAFDHSGVVDNCEMCHNNVITVGKLSNHLPTNADCGICHGTTEFANTPFNHFGIDSNNCALCHDGNIALGKPVNHVPTSLDCSACHVTNDFNSFAGISFNHLGIDPNNCASCHATGIATPKPLNHIPAHDDCSVCHDSTDIFASTTFLSSVHQNLTRGCEGCHTTKFLSNRPDLFKAAGHVPTGQDCYLCHTVQAFKPSVFAHTGITGNCASCHDGKTSHVAVGALGAPDTTIHRSTNQDCGTCHNTVSFANAYVDHSGPEVVGKRCDSCHDGGAGGAIGKHASHIPTNKDCAVCHVPGSFTTAVFSHSGIVDNCASCHNGTKATGKTADHLPTTEDCSLCHVTTAFAGARFDHTGIVDGCASCHNGTTARGKTPPPDHVPTNQDCNICHVTTGFIPASFSHAGIVDNCGSCHNNVFAIGKSVSHVSTNQDCGVCHTTSSFVGAGFDHTGIVDNCSTCHGVTATGKHSTHIATALDCHFCHTTATFVGGTWTHDASSAGRCDDCHNNSGGGARSKPAGHLNTNVQCDVCHSTERWAPDIFSHDPRGDYPGDHRRNPGCSGCHGSTISSTFVWPFPRYAPHCAGCHANDFRSEGDHIGGRSGTVEQNKNCGRSGCHSISSRGF